MKWYEKLKFARRVKGLTLRDVESELWVSNSYISQLENGQVENPGFFIMVRLLELYNLSLSDITLDSNDIIKLRH